MKKLRRKIYNYSKKTGDKLGLDLPYFVENGFWMLLNQFVSLFNSLILSVFLARYLSKESFGHYQLVLSIISLLALFSLPGLNVSIARSVAKGFDFSYITAYKTAFKWSFFGIPVFMGIAFWYYFHNNAQVAFALMIAALFFPFIYGFNKWIALFKGKSMFENIARIQMLQNLISSGFLILIVFLFPDNLLILILFLLGAQMIFALFAHLKAIKYVKTDKIDHECIPYGKYMTKINVLAVLLNNFDKIIIGFLDIKLLAVYAIALKLLDVIKSMTKSFYSISFPKFAQKNIKISDKTVLFLFLTGALLSIVLYFISTPLINFLYTDKYLASAEYFTKFLLIVPLFFINPLYSNKILAGKNNSKILYIRIFAPLLSVILSISVFLFSNNAEHFILTKIFSIHILNFIILTPWFIKD